MIIYFIDFKLLSVIELENTAAKKWNVTSIKKITVDSKITENIEIKKIVDYYLGKNEMKNSTLKIYYSMYFSQ